MRVPSREFESRALSEIRALPAARPLRAILKLRGGERAHPPRRGGCAPFLRAVIRSGSPPRISFRRPIDYRFDASPVIRCGSDIKTIHRSLSLSLIVKCIFLFTISNVSLIIRRDYLGDVIQGFRRKVLCTCLYGKQFYLSLFRLFRDYVRVISYLIESILLLFQVSQRSLHGQDRHNRMRIPSK